MFTATLEKRLQNVILATLLTMSLVITPWFNMDPISLPKFSILVVAGFYLVGICLRIPKGFRAIRKDTYALFICLFICALICAFWFGGKANFSQLYGTFGRYTGLLAYLVLGIVSLVAMRVSELRFQRRITWVLVSSALVNCVYGSFQYLGLDPIDWSNPYNPIVGTFGNPNFASAFLGMGGVVCFSLLLDSSLRKVLRALIFFQLAISILLTLGSNSSQGFLIFILGAYFVFYVRYLKFSHYKSLSISYLFLGVVSIFTGIFGVLNRGPLASFLHQDSVTYRGDYWTAGWNMAKANPVFGVGLDGYGDWYRYFRTEDAALRRGPDAISNSAHNVLLDILSNGGIFLFIAYVSLLFITIKSAYKIVRSIEGFDSAIIGLIAVWGSYQIQSLVSINQLGLAIWGWVLGGVIVGYEKLNPAHPQKSKKNEGNTALPAATTLKGYIGLVLGCTIAILPLAKDIQFRSALESGIASRIEAVVNRFPNSTYYTINLSEIYLSNKLNDKALVAARKATEINPREFNAWKVLIANPNISKMELERATAVMKSLDPFNETIGRK